MTLWIDCAAQKTEQGFGDNQKVSVHVKTVQGQLILEVNGQGAIVNKDQAVLIAAALVHGGKE